MTTIAYMLTIESIEGGLLSMACNTPDSMGNGYQSAMKTRLQFWVFRITCLGKIVQFTHLFKSLKSG